MDKDKGSEESEEEEEANTIQSPARTEAINYTIPFDHHHCKVRSSSHSMHENTEREVK